MKKDKPSPVSLFLHAGIVVAFCFVVSCSKDNSAQSAAKQEKEPDPYVDFKPSSFGVYAWDGKSWREFLLARQTVSFSGSAEPSIIVFSPTLNNVSKAEAFCQAQELLKIRYEIGEMKLNQSQSQVKGYDLRRSSRIVYGSQVVMPTAKPMNDQRDMVRYDFGSRLEPGRVWNVTVGELAVQIGVNAPAKGATVAEAARSLDCVYDHYLAEGYWEKFSREHIGGGGELPNPRYVDPATTDVSLVETLIKEVTAFAPPRNTYMVSTACSCLVAMGHPKAAELKASVSEKIKSWIGSKKSSNPLEGVVFLNGFRSLFQSTGLFAGDLDEIIKDHLGIFNNLWKHAQPPTKAVLQADEKAFRTFIELRKFIAQEREKFPGEILHGAVRDRNNFQHDLYYFNGWINVSGNSDIFVWLADTEEPEIEEKEEKLFLSTEQFVKFKLKDKFGGVLDLELEPSEKNAEALMSFLEQSWAKLPKDLEWAEKLNGAKPEGGTLEYTFSEGRSYIGITVKPGMVTPYFPVPEAASLDLDDIRMNWLVEPEDNMLRSNFPQKPEIEEHAAEKHTFRLVSNYTSGPGNVVKIWIPLKVSFP